MDRRTSLKWVMAAAATMPALAGSRARAATATELAGLNAGGAAAAGYGTDPRLSIERAPGDYWPLTLSAAERRLAGVLADLILPADESSPAATAAGVVDFIDEWISAPYPQQQRDRELLQGGLAWLDAEAQRRRQTGFVGLAADDQHGICELVCSVERAAPELKERAAFFARFRDIAAGGYYSSPFGRRDLQYLGNVAMDRFEGPPVALLQRLGLT